MLKYKYIYLIGIGGIGMSALALFFLKKGVKVYGYDREISNVTKGLENQGVNIVYDLNLDHLKLFKTSIRNNSLIIYTPAVKKNNLFLEYFIKREFVVKKRAQILGNIISNNKVIAVSGTHGKTTITSLISHIMHDCKINITAFIGGFLKSQNSNLIFSDNPDYFIVEADEYDRSFLNIKPNISVVSSIDMDHVDVYYNKNQLIDSFNKFIGSTTDKVIINNNIINYFNINNVLFETYNGDDSNFLYKKTINYLKYILPGIHNLENINAAIKVCVSLGLGRDNINKALLNFKGILRRFQFHERNKFVLIEDYAHHPKEIEATLNTVKSLYNKEKITVFFQPHLFSRTSYFMKEFAESLSIADNVLLYNIYGAREKNIKKITSLELLNLINSEYKEIVDIKMIDFIINKLKPKITLVLGAGDITKSVKKIYKSLKSYS